MCIRVTFLNKAEPGQSDYSQLRRWVSFHAKEEPEEICLNRPPHFADIGFLDIAGMNHV
jgi:hypothetical protein